MGGRPYVLAIAGGSASGKSTFARHLEKSLAPLTVAIVPEDAYYYSVPSGLGEDGKPFNFDRPETKEFPLLRDHIAGACRGEAFDLPVYDFATHTRTGQTVRIAPCDVLIIEGMHNIGDEALRALADLAVFVEASHAVRQSRRITRDVAERGREAGATLRQFEEVVAPMHDLHIEPLRHHASLIVTNTEADPRGLAAAADELAMNIRSILAART